MFELLLQVLEAEKGIAQCIWWFASELRGWKMQKSSFIEKGNVVVWLQRAFGGGAGGACSTCVLTHSLPGRVVLEELVRVLRVR